MGTPIRKPCRIPIVLDIAVEQPTGDISEPLFAHLIRREYDGDVEIHAGSLWRSKLLIRMPEDEVTVEQALSTARTVLAHLRDLLVRTAAAIDERLTDERPLRLGQSHDGAPSS